MWADSYVFNAINPGAISLTVATDPCTPCSVSSSKRNFLRRPKSSYICFLFMASQCHPINFVFMTTPSCIRCSYLILFLSSRCLGLFFENPGCFCLRVFVLACPSARDAVLHDHCFVQFSYSSNVSLPMDSFYLAKLIFPLWKNLLTPDFVAFPLATRK